MVSSPVPTSFASILGSARPIIQLVIAAHARSMSVPGAKWTARVSMIPHPKGALASERARILTDSRQEDTPVEKGWQGGSADVEGASATRVSSLELDTMPKLLLRNAAQFASRPAYREKDLGIWQTWTWSQVCDEVRAFAIGLYVLGLKRGETVAIIGDNRPQLYWTFAAAQSIGAIPVPVYQDAVAAEMVYVLSHAEIAFAI